jgi:DNA-binding IclR family transcriptional regulator
MSEQHGITLEGSVPRAFAVLELLATQTEPMRLSALALQLGLQKSTAHRMLGTLIDLGYVEQDAASGCYQATLRLWEMGTGLIAHHRIKQVATRFLQQLHGATGETVSLTILSGHDVLYLDKLVSPRPTRFTSRVGSRVPAVLTAGGKAILALSPDARSIARQSLAAVKDQRRVGIDAFMKELKEIRAQGYAESSFRPGVVSYGAPILGQADTAAAALSVSAPTSRLSEKKRERIIDQLLATCADIAEEVGVLV